MDRPNNSLKDFLCAEGFKSTKGRKIILKELETRGEHFNAESLYSALSQKKQRVSRPTIYRTLKLLEKLHLIERFDIKKNCFYYEPLLHRGEHGHLICEECGKIVDFSIGDFGTIKSAIVKEKDFTLGYLSIRAFGLCQSCLKASKTPRGETSGRKKMSGRNRVVIIGGSAAGPSAAARAKRTNPEIERYKDHDGMDFERNSKFRRLA